MKLFYLTSRVAAILEANGKVFPWGCPMYIIGETMQTKFNNFC